MWFLLSTKGYEGNKKQLQRVGENLKDVGSSDEEIYTYNISCLSFQRPTPTQCSILSNSTKHP